MKFFTCLAPKMKQDDEESPLEAARAWDRAISNKAFTFHQLAQATQTFSLGNLLGQGNFGRVYKGTINDQPVAVKQLMWKESEDIQEFQMEVKFLSKLSHQNLVDLIGYCCDGNQKLLVYEYMCKGSLDSHLFNIPAGQEPLSWYQRMKIALDVAEGLEYLHNKEKLPIIYQDLKCSNILLGEQYNAKLSDLGQGNFGITAATYLSISYMVYKRYEPEYLHARELTAKSDIYSHGVLMLELITGRRRSQDKQGLVMWARQMLGDKQRYQDLVDQSLKGHYSEQGLNKAVAFAMMCVQENPELRPTIGDVIRDLRHLANEPEDGLVARAKDQASSSSRKPPPPPPPPTPAKT